MGALEASIINQTSLHDAIKLRKPMQIIHGALDPVVVGKNLKTLAKRNSQAKLSIIVAGHEVSGLYVSTVVKAIRRAVDPQFKSIKQSKIAD